MMTQRENGKRGIRKETAIAVLLFLFAVFIIPLNAYAQVSITSPPNSGVREGFGMRSATRAHKGVDFAVSCGTPMTVKGTVTCHSDPAGYGAWALVSYGCGVEERYAHLQRCVAGDQNLISGGAKGAAGAGNSTGCHLHYEIRINGCPVDPQQAFGKDLCQQTVKDQLTNSAKSSLGQYATCSAGGGGTQTNTDNPTTDDGGLKSVTQVPTGGTDPVTGVVNTGDSYFISETTDGRIIVEPDHSTEENTTPVLPPTDTTPVPPGGATNNAVTGCSTDTWTAMVNEAVLQTRREMLYNERYIAKADSILAYSCFSEAYFKVGQTLGPVFSETKLWVNKQIDLIGKTTTVNKELGDTSLDGAINNAVTDPYESFLNANFNHDFLGGQLAAAGGGGGEEGEADSVQSHVPCGKMAEVWQQAKCMNITDETPFKRFSELIEADSDPRIYPQNAQCKNTGIAQNMIDIANGTETKFDKITAYMDMLMPDGNTCAQPLSTGVTVVRKKGSGIITQTINYQDGLCISPGCSYQNPGGSGNGTCEVKGP